jgi:hypothetical protein
MSRKKRKSKSRGAKPRRAQSSRSRQARQEGWKKWLPIAALILAAILIGVGGVWFLTRRGDTGPTVTEATIANPADDVPRITVQELKAKLDAGQAVVFDAREQSAYAYKHIAGAISMPQEEVDARVAELPTDKLAVFYCT